MFKRVKVVGGSALAVSVLIVFAAQYVKPEAAASQAQRQVQSRIATKIEPVVVTRITYGNVTVQPGRFVKPVGAIPDSVTPFLADDDWVQNIAVYLLNRTNRTIVYASLTFDFPETTIGRSRAVFPLALGRIPPSAAAELNGVPVRRPSESQPILLAPSKTLAIHLGDYIDQIKADVEPVRPLAALTIMNVNLGRFFFENGMQWNGGYRVFDPLNSTWRKMDPDYVPGDMDGRWPGRAGWIGQQVW
jgi:hypothetical protein